MCEIVVHMAALSERIIVSVERGGVGKKNGKKLKFWSFISDPLSNLVR